MNATEALNIEKLKEVSTQEANELLLQGWIVLRCFIIQKNVEMEADGRRIWTEVPYFVMAKVKKT